ncbi:MAG: hypothetical protein J6V70_01080 [Kiritimatiellae bacterium]|nr:hypothetical protein [Kiritimatiellia bacterium]
MSTINLNNNNNPVISDRHQNPLAGNNGTPTKKENFTAFAILAIISTVLFLALVFILWTEFSFIKTV